VRLVKTETTHATVATETNTVREKTSSSLRRKLTESPMLPKYCLIASFHRA
jgi:hypothetical protein